MLTTYNQSNKLKPQKSGEQSEIRSYRRLRRLIGSALPLRSAGVRDSLCSGRSRVRVPNHLTPGAVTEFTVGLGKQFGRMLVFEPFPSAACKEKKKNWCTPAGTRGPPHGTRPAHAQTIRYSYLGRALSWHAVGRESVHKSLKHRRVASMSGACVLCFAPGALKRWLRGVQCRIHTSRGGRAWRDLHEPWA